jgi:hypothetical protein
VASRRVSGYFNSRKWPHFIINIRYVAFIRIVFNQITFVSANLAVYLETFPWQSVSVSLVAVYRQIGRYKCNLVKDYAYESNITNIYYKLRPFSAIGIIRDPLIMMPLKGIQCT